MERENAKFSLILLDDMEEGQLIRLDALASHASVRKRKERTHAFARLTLPHQVRRGRLWARPCITYVNDLPKSGSLLCGYATSFCTLILLRVQYIFIYENRLGCRTTQP